MGRLVTMVLLAATLSWVGQSSATAATDGEFVTYQGITWAIVGGAPLPVTSWASVGGERPTRAITDQEWTTLRQYPTDGTFVRAVESGAVYVVTGNAPTYVSYAYYVSMNPAPPVFDIDGAAIDNAGGGGEWDHLRAYPADQTYVRVQESGERYVIAGGAPLVISDAYFASLSPTPAVTRVSQEQIDSAGSDTHLVHMRYRPADGTKLSAAGVSYVVKAGIAVPQTTYQGGIPVDPQAISRAGESRTFLHLLPRETLPPATTILGGPSATSAPGTLYFSFSSSEAGSTFECALDGAGFTPCASPYGVNVTTVGPHVFAARAIDPAGNVDATPATRSFSIASNTLTPTLTVKVRAKRARTRLSINVDPDWANANYKCVVLRKKDGRFQILKKVRTRGVRDARVIDLPRGRYRVRVPAQNGAPQVVSRVVRLVR